MKYTNQVPEYRHPNKINPFCGFQECGNQQLMVATDYLHSICKYHQLFGYPHSSIYLGLNKWWQNLFWVSYPFKYCPPLDRYGSLMKWKGTKSRKWFIFQHLPATFFRHFPFPSSVILQLLQMMETPSPFSVSVFNDEVYWSDTKRGTIQRAHKITGKLHQVLLKRPGQPFGLKASIP